MDGLSVGKLTASFHFLVNYPFKAVHPELTPMTANANLFQSGNYMGIINNAHF